jgi:hypothetical protein
VRIERYRRRTAELRIIENWEDHKARESLLREAEANEQMTAMLANSGTRH